MANMIRKMHVSEIDTVTKIWLDGNLEAHNFINPNYWINYLPEVKEEFKTAEIYVYVEKKVKGFVGLNEDYIAGIFVAKDARDQGIGKQLLDFLKNNHTKLSLDVYDRNKLARKFYERNNFVVDSSNIDSENDEKEYRLVWHQ